MPIKVNVDVSNLVSRLKKFEANLNTLPWLEVGQLVKKSVQDNFVAGGRPTKWVPRTRKYPHPILRKSLKLMNSIYVEPGKNKVAIGTRVIYQAVHQFGHNFSDGRSIPARPYLMVQPQDIKDIQVIFRRHILSGKV